MQRDVSDELRWEPSLDAAQIGVAVYKGIVTLTGHIRSYAEKMMAETAARRVKGVKALVEDMQIRLASSSVRSDEEIAELAFNALSSHVGLPSDRIKIKVEGGHLTLDGDVNWQYQRDAAIVAVKHISGLKGLSNFLFVKPEANATIVKDDIERALHRKADLNAADIIVIAEANKVTLRGTVRSWAERQIAEYTAWSSPGVSSVADELEVIS